MKKVKIVDQIAINSWDKKASKILYIYRSYISSSATNEDQQEDIDYKEQIRNVFISSLINLMISKNVQKRHAIVQAWQIRVNINKKMMIEENNENSDWKNLFDTSGKREIRLWALE